jgi:hypothetical protein
MITYILGFPVYIGEFKNPEKTLEDIEKYLSNIKLQFTSFWNANCLSTHKYGSGKYITPFDSKEFEEETDYHVNKMMEELKIPITLTPNRCQKDYCNHDHKNCREFWINKYTKSHHQRKHTHALVQPNRPNCLFSSIYIAKTPQEYDEHIYFETPYPIDDLCCEEWSCREEFKNKKFFQKLKMGNIIVFPSFLMHGVTSTNSTTPRITVATNFFKKND